MPRMMLIRIHDHFSSVTLTITAEQLRRTVARKMQELHHFPLIPTYQALLSKYGHLIQCALC